MSVTCYPISDLVCFPPNLSTAMATVLFSWSSAFFSVKFQVMCNCHVNRAMPPSIYELPSHVSHCYMWATVKCEPLSHVSHCHIWATYTCEPLSHMSHCHMWATVTYNPLSHVIHCHKRATVTCEPLSHVSHYHLWADFESGDSEPDFDKDILTF